MSVEKCSVILVGSDVTPLTLLTSENCPLPPVVSVSSAPYMDLHWRLVKMCSLTLDVSTKYALQPGSQCRQYIKGKYGQSYFDYTSPIGHRSAVRSDLL